MQHKKYHLLIVLALCLLCFSSFDENVLAEESSDSLYQLGIFQGIPNVNRDNIELSKILNSFDLLEKVNRESPLVNITVDEDDQTNPMLTLVFETSQTRPIKKNDKLIFYLAEKSELSLLDFKYNQIINNQSDIFDIKITSGKLVLRAKKNVTNMQKYTHVFKIDHNSLNNSDITNGMVEVIATYTGNRQILFRKKEKLNYNFTKKRKIKGNSPILNVSEKEKSISKHALVDSSDILYGVDATDVEDGEISKNKISYILPDNFKLNQENLEGDYQVKYSVTDSDGNNTTNFRMYHVKNDVPVINLHSVTIEKDGQWSPEDNFINAYDENGNLLSYDQLTEIPGVGANSGTQNYGDPSQYGIYPIHYSYQNTTAYTTLIVKGGGSRVELSVKNHYLVIHYYRVMSFEIDLNGQVYRHFNVKLSDTENSITVPYKIDNFRSNVEVKYEDQETGWHIATLNH